ncbi:MAG TPA: prephenate dehydrogenase [Natrialbaceae archaeon]|nr:prephenate dehydrogenase [Natrialbaceae archaeon]
MNVLVVGAGQMGRWVGRTVEADVAFADVDPSVAQEAASALDARAVALDAGGTFDAVCFAVPMSAVEEAIAEYSGRAERAVFDVAGSMHSPVRAMREHAPDLERVSLHPLFAPDAAPGNVAVVSDAPGPTIDGILEDIVDAGNDLVETTPREHDDAMATVQAGAHAAILAYAIQAADVPDHFGTPVSEGLDELASRVLDGDPDLYAEIQATFDGAEAIATATDGIARADRAAFVDLYREASERWRDRDG